jgi:hypothetical protein
MKKTKQYFFRIAVLKTFIVATTYLLAPLFAKWYFPVAGDFWGYPVFASFILFVFSMIILVQAWILVFDSEYREKYLKNE